MKCARCGGSGYHPKHRNCYHSSYDAYIKGCNDQRRCGLCLGFGVTGPETVRQILTEIKIESSDMQSRKLATKALQEWDE